MSNDEHSRLQGGITTKHPHKCGMQKNVENSKKQLICLKTPNSGAVQMNDFRLPNVKAVLGTFKGKKIC